MSKNLKKCMNKLNFLASIKNDTLRKKILKSISDECLFKAINEIAKNYNTGNIKIHPIKRNKMKKFDRLIKKLGNDKIKKSTRRRLMLQSGGFLPILIPALTSILTSLIN